MHGHKKKEKDVFFSVYNRWGHGYTRFKTHLVSCGIPLARIKMLKRECKLANVKFS
jgi:hypothetical protein